LDARSTEVHGSTLRGRYGAWPIAWMRKRLRIVVPQGERRACVFG